MTQVRNVTVAGLDNGSTGAVVVPAGVVGDVLFVAHIVDNDTPGLANMTAPSGAGFAERVAFTNNYVPRLKIWTRTYDGTEPASYTFTHDTTGGSRSWALVAMSLYDIDPAAPVLTHTTASRTTSSTVFTGPSATATAVGQLSLVFGAALRYNEADTGAAFYTPPAAYAERYDVGQVWLHPVAYTRTLAASGATGAVDAAISQAMSAGQSSVHVLFSHQVAAPAGPEPGRALLAT